MLRLVATASAAAEAAGREIAVCGGLGSDPDAIPILLGLGVRELSVVAGAVPRVKRIVRGLSESACKALATEALAKTSAREVRELVQSTTAT